MSTAMPHDVSPSKRILAEPAVRRSLEDFVRRRVPASDVDDIVQTVLVEALASATRPQAEDELKRWLIGIARHKVVDHHRRRTRETASELLDLPVGPGPLEERSLVDWAEKQAGRGGDGGRTLEWMAREGEGEKLETIAAEEKMPAARVRQRVSRMRRWMKERWLAELAAAAVLAVLALLLWRLFHRDDPIAVPEPRPRSTSEVTPSPIERAHALREKAFEECDRSKWKECLEKLDEAKGLDPAGDRDPKVGAARAKANDALRNEAPAPTAAPTAPPTSAPTSGPAPVMTAPMQKKSTTVKQPPKAKPELEKPWKSDVDVKQEINRTSKSKK